MLLAVYGTLREGDFNHEVLGILPKFLTQERLPGFQMYKYHAGHPYIIHEQNATVLVEVYDIPPEVYGRISEMERNAGYYAASVKTSVGTAKIFVWSERQHEITQRYGRTPKILSGDWFEWLRKYAPERLAS